MSTDPFDEAPHDKSAPLIRPALSPHVHGRTGSLDFSSPGASPASRVVHRRGVSADGSCDVSLSALAVPLPSHHARTRSSEIDGHMSGSVYAPHELCPKCKSARSSSVYCPVSRLHHGTDEPLPDVPDTVKEEPKPATDPTMVDTPTPKKKGWSIFKTKEEKELVAIEDAEEAARKKIAKSHSNPDGEKYARNVIRQSFVDALKIIAAKERNIVATEKLEHETRETIEFKQERNRRAVLADEAKGRKQILKKNPDAIRRTVEAEGAAAAESGGTPGESEAPAGVPETPNEVCTPGSVREDESGGTLEAGATPTADGALSSAQT